MIRTQDELNELVDYALVHMALIKSRGEMWTRLEVTQFNTPYVAVVIGPIVEGKRQTEYGTYVYYMGERGPTYRKNLRG
jgi:hypothetical protein